MKRAIGPYQISERIGTGGMGEVFKARDDRLDRWVAIKRIRPGKEDTDENRERFAREAKATARLNHPSIVHIYDTLLDGESNCIVMEYVEGPTLQSMTADGPLNALRVTEIGREIAEGLAAAHGKNILHRDLKTENIMVTPEGRAKILDFGLAKPLISKEFDSSLTGKGQLVGTSRSMSPEYVGGDNVDHRSDLFALGVLLYEISTGHSPFKAQNTLATLKQVIVHQQPPVRELNPDIPQEFSDLVDRLLEKSPEDRPQSANEVAAELGRVSGYYSSESIERSASSPSHSFTTNGEWSLSETMSHPRLRRYWVSIVVIVIAALAAAYFLGRLKQASPSSKEKVSIVLGSFNNKTNNPLLDDSLEVALRTDLEQSRFISILPEEHAKATLTRMQKDPETPINRQLGIEICQREGAQALIIGSIVSVGESYSLSAEIIDSNDQTDAYAVTGAAATQGEILEVLHEIVTELRSYLGESLASMEKNSQPLDKVTTRNLEALKLYSLGSAKTGRHFEEIVEAIDFLEQAIELDPEFAMAHVKLGVAYQGVGRNDKVVYHFDQAQKSSERLTRFENLYVKGWLATFRKTPEETIHAWNHLITIFPENYQGHHNVGMTYWLFLNQFAEAAQEFQEALKYVDLQHRGATAFALGYCQIALDKFAEATATFEEGDRPESVADVYLVQERYTDALNGLNALDDTPGIEVLKAHYYLDQGQFAEGGIWAQRARDKADEDGNVIMGLRARMTLMNTLRHSANRENFISVLEDSIEKANFILQDTSTVRVLTPIPFLATIGKIGARASAVEHAEKIYATIREIAEQSGIDLWISYVRMLEGEILMAKNQPRGAIEKLEEAARIAESFQVHESLASAFEINGDVEKAIQESLWIEKSRGRAFGECYSICSVRSANILDWNISLLRLGRLYEASSRPDEAREFHQRFVTRWADAEESPLLQEAIKRLESLGD